MKNKIYSFLNFISLLLTGCTAEDESYLNNRAVKASAPSRLNNAERRK
jgi:PBP1b-binding outer membrane lipoprotein LpoB